MTFLFIFSKFGKLIKDLVYFTVLQFQRAYVYRIVFYFIIHFIPFFFFIGIFFHWSNYLN